MAVLCLSGIAWLILCFVEAVPAVDACLTRNIFGIPCPSCGTSRAIVLLLKGETAAGLMMNPFGVLSLILLVSASLTMVYDLATGSRKLQLYYTRAEMILRTRWLAMALTGIVLLNWGWNLTKFS